MLCSLAVQTLIQNIDSCSVAIKIVNWYDLAPFKRYLKGVL